MEDKDWISNSAHDAESLINLIPTHLMKPDQMGLIARYRWSKVVERLSQKQASKLCASQITVLRKRDHPVVALGTPWAGRR